GRKDTFRRLLMLLDEDLFQADELVTQRIGGAQVSGEAFEAEAAITKARNRFFLRRLKEEMVDWDSQPLFRPRHTKTVGYELTPEELDLYTEVTQYVRSKRKEAAAKKNRNVELTLMVMQRRLASSIYAITCTLRNRLAALDHVLKILLDPHRTEAKFGELLKVLDSSGVIRREDEKLLIFTEHRDTLENLAERLRHKGYTVATIHGGMDVDARKQAQRDFRTKAKIMVATDAAGEGIN